MKSEKNADRGGIAPAQTAIRGAESYQKLLGAMDETFSVVEMLCPSIQRNIPMVSSWTCDDGFQQCWASSHHC